jgi:hypothetical protein
MRRTDYVTELGRESTVIGVGLVISGILGLTTALLSNPIWLPVALLLFVLGFLIAAVAYRYSGLDEAALRTIGQVPGNLSSEPAFRFGLRILETSLAGGAFCAAAFLLTPHLVPAVAGLVFGKGFDEIRVGRWLNQWQERNDRLLLGVVPAIFYYSRESIPLVYTVLRSKRVAT